MKSIILSGFLVFFLGSTLIQSCQKTDGYYNYVNTESVYNGTTYDYLVSKPGVFDSLLLVLNRVPEYREFLQSEEATLFAPTNESFAMAIGNLNLVRRNENKAALRLSTVELVELDTLLSKYMGVGSFPTDSMLNVDGLYLPTFRHEQPMHGQRIKEESSGFAEGGLIRVYFSDTKGSNFVSQWIRSTSEAVNIRTNNGIIHVVGGNHEFGFNEFITRMNN